jgi:transcriptional regulator with XRE-family HTH domain
MATISEKIFELLAERGMTQREFAQRTGISQSAISDWKQKKTNPSAEKILEICSVLAVSPYELLAGTAEGVESGVEMQYIVVDNKSEEYAFLRRFHLLEASKKKRLLGYLDSLVD